MNHLVFFVADGPVREIRKTQFYKGIHGELCCLVSLFPGRRGSFPSTHMCNLYLFPQGHVPCHLPRGYCIDQLDTYVFRVSFYSAIFWHRPAYIIRISNPPYQSVCFVDVTYQTHFKLVITQPSQRSFSLRQLFEALPIPSLKAQGGGHVIFNNARLMLWGGHQNHVWPRRSSNLITLTTSPITSINICANFKLVL